MYEVSVKLTANEQFKTKREADIYASRWLTRLAGADTPGTWEYCDWEVSNNKEG